MKTCRVCSEEKPLSAFPVRSASKDGRRNDCKVCKSRRHAEYYSQNSETVKSRSNARYRANRDEILAAERERRQNDPNFRAYRSDVHRRWVENNREHKAAYDSEWRKKNPVSKLASESKRRALKRGATVGDVDMAEILGSRDDCYLCGGQLTGVVHVDHVVPLIKGGAHIMGNLLPTHDTCNLRKNDRLLYELDWYHGPTDLGVSVAKLD